MSVSVTVSRCEVPPMGEAGGPCGGRRATSCVWVRVGVPAWKWVNM